MFCVPFSVVSNARPFSVYGTVFVRCVAMADKNMKENDIPAAAAFVSVLR